MLTINNTVCCLVLVLTGLTDLSRTAVLPPTTTTTLGPPPPDFVDQYAGKYWECSRHSDCYCTIGVGFCYNGYCTCIWLQGYNKPEDIPEEELAALVSQNPTNSSGIDKPEDTNTL